MKKLLIILAFMPLFGFGQLQIMSKGKIVFFQGEIITQKNQIIVSAYNSIGYADYYCDSINDNEQIDSAIVQANSEGKNVRLLPGNYIIGKHQNDRITKLQNVSIYGYGATITIPDSCNNDSPSVIECEGGTHNYTGIYGLTIDGNYENQQSFTAENGYPVGGSGIVTAEADYADGDTLYELDYDGITYTKTLADSVTIQDCNIINMVRNNLLMPGTGHRIINTNLSVSWKDHNIYISSGEKQIYTDVTIDTMASAAIAVYKGSEDITDIIPNNIIFTNLKTSCLFKYNGVVQTFQIVGNSGDSITNISITNWTVDGTNGHLESNTHAMIDADYTTTLTCDVDLINNKYTSRPAEMMLIQNSRDITIDLDGSVSNSVFFGTTSVFSIYDSKDCDFSGSSMTSTGDKIDNFLTVSGNCQDIDISNSTFDGGILVKENASPVSGMRNIEVADINYDSTITDADSVIFSINNIDTNVVYLRNSGSGLYASDTVKLSNIYGLFAWYDDSVTVIDDEVSVWIDKSINQLNITQSNADNRPEWTGDALSFKRDSTDNMEIPDTFIYAFGGYRDATVLGVAEFFNDATANYYTILAIATDDTTGFWFGSFQSTIRFRAFADVGNTYISTTTGVSNADHVFTLNVESPSVIGMRLDGTVQGNTLQFTASLGKEAKLGIFNISNLHGYNKEIKALIFYDWDLPEYLKYEVEKYLNNKYTVY